MRWNYNLLSHGELRQPQDKQLANAASYQAGQAGRGSVDPIYLLRGFLRKACSGSLEVGGSSAMHLASLTARITAL